MSHASAQDRAYFARVAEQSRALADERPPQSLAETFERLETLQRRLGAWAQPGVAGSDEGDLDEHRALLAGLARGRGQRAARPR